MSKEKFLIVFTFLTIINVMCAFSNRSNKMIDKNESFNNKSNFVAMMVETEDGIYERSASNEWLTDGYEFNEELSKCENGGELSWDSSKNSVVLTGNAGDKCYLYFSKIDPNAPKPTNPTIAFDQNFNVVLSGSTSENGDVEYYYSFDNVNFIKGNSIPVSDNSTIYVYAKDAKKRKSEVVSKTITIGTAVNETVSSTYYCSKSSKYQSSSSCTYTYNATASTTLQCSQGTYDSSAGYCYITNGKWEYWADCNNQCSNKVYNSNGYPCSCEYSDSSDKYYLTLNVGSPTTVTTYSCSSGDSLSGSKCTNSYTGTLKYKCGTKYYNTNNEATTACTNYCATGTYYNNKCYSLS